MPKHEKHEVKMQVCQNHEKTQLKHQNKTQELLQQEVKAQMYATHRNLRCFVKRCILLGKSAQK